MNTAIFYLLVIVVISAVFWLAFRNKDTEKKNIANPLPQVNDGKSKGDGENKQ